MGGVNTQAAQDGFNEVAVIKASQLTQTASATAQTIDIAKIPADAYVEKVSYYLIDEMDGGSVSALTVTLGDEDDADGYVTAKSILAGATPVSSAINDGAYHNDGTTANTVNGKHYDNASEKTLQAVFTPTGDSLANINEGKILIKAKIVDLSLN